MCSFQVGNDEFGVTVLQELKEAGIDTSHVIVRIFADRAKLVISLLF
jgi:sugar/nucleoside kinase (ribokinase family)